MHLIILICRLWTDTRLTNVNPLSFRLSTNFIVVSLLAMTIPYTNLINPYSTSYLAVSHFDVAKSCNIVGRFYELQCLIQIGSEMPLATASCTLLQIYIQP